MKMFDGNVKFYEYWLSWFMPKIRPFFTKTLIFGQTKPNCQLNNNCKFAWITTKLIYDINNYYETFPVGNSMSSI